MKLLEIDKLRSAEVLTDPDAIIKHLRQRDSGPVATSDDEGRLKFHRFAARDGSLPIPPVDELRKLAKKRRLEVDDETLVERAHAWWLSDERVDGFGDIVKQNWDFSEYEKNSVIPYSHRWHEPPIGNGLDWKVLDRKETGKQSYDGPALWFLGLFASDGDNPFGDLVFRLTKSGFLKGISAGFYADEVIIVNDEEEREKLGLGRFGVILNKNHLLEASPTTLPANSGAYSTLALAKSKGLLRDEDINGVRELYRARSSDGDEWRKNDTAVRSWMRTLFPEVELQEHDDFEEPFITLVSDDDTETRETNVDLSEVNEKLDKVLAVLDTSVPSLISALEDVRSLTEDLALKAGINLDNASDPDDESLQGNDVEEALRKLEEAQRSLQEAIGQGG